MNDVVKALLDEARFRPTIWGEARPLLVVAAHEIERKQKALEAVLRTMTEDDYTPEGGRTLAAVVREAIAPATCRELTR